MGTDKIFADTNLFLRYLTDDIPEQAEAFGRMLGNAVGGDFSFVTNALVIAEIVWTLESYYGLSKGDIQAKVLAILNTPGLEVVDHELILQAMLWYSEKNVDFIDAYNAAWMLDKSIGTVCSFDRKHFARFEGLTTKVPGE